MKIYQCSCCEYSTDRKYNIDRHMFVKHIEAYKNQGTIQAIQKEKNISENGGKYIPSTNSPFTCKKCCKTFTTLRWMKHHDIKCKGVVDSHTCEYCKTIFSNPCNKYRHLKTCKKKKEVDQMALVPTNTAKSAGTVPGSENGCLVNNITNNFETQNNNNTNIQNQQNNNVNIIVFNPNDMQFLTDHIDIEKITKMIARDTRRPEERQEPRAIISTYGRDLLGRPENKCIQKKNLRANYAKVHMGKNKWKSMLDQDVYPKLACNIANTFQSFLHSCTDDVKTNIRLYVRERMIPFLDYMAEQGYCNDEERAQHVMEQFNALVQELRLVTFDLTVENGE
jgi:hypothetical protein